jgi:hypothetical protein
MRGNGFAWDVNENTLVSVPKKSTSADPKPGNNVAQDGYASLGRLAENITYAEGGDGSIPLSISTKISED